MAFAPFFLLFLKAVGYLHGRPPVEKRTVELPAGLIDPGEDAEQAGLREVCDGSRSLAFPFP